ncbi:MAG: hypothetical protein ACYCWW_16930 [Deltaproteobacteria bacterium]
MATLVRYGLPTTMAIEMLSSTLKKWCLHAEFVGDLDPLDLTIFASYYCGDSNLTQPQKAALPMRYLGIDDQWLEICEQNLRAAYRPAGISAISFEMSPAERRHFEIVEELLGGQLEKWVGPRCVSLLRSGQKVELEGASNPAFYRKGFRVKLLMHLLGKRRPASRG